MASNFCYSFVSAFTMIYLTDTVGMNAGIIGMLIMLSRVFDGVSDVFAGNIIDKTHHRLGKARSWMLWTIIPVALVQILMFSIPNTDQIFQYAYFFVTYTLLNAVFYTLNNVHMQLFLFLLHQTNRNVCSLAYSVLFLHVWQAYWFPVQQ